jgi:hypothetical protein
MSKTSPLFITNAAAGEKEAKSVNATGINETHVQVLNP